MAHCINKAHEQYKSLLKFSGLKDPILAAKIAIWQQANNKMDSFPTLDELLPDNSKSTSVPFQKVLPTFNLQETLKKQYIQEGLIDSRGNVKDYPKMLVRNRQITEELAAAHNITIELRERVYTLSGQNNQKATLNYSFLNKINQKFGVIARANGKLEKIINETKAQNVIDYTQSQRELNYDISRNTGILSEDIRGESISFSSSLSTSLGGESDSRLEKRSLFPTESNGGNSDSFKSKISGKTYKEIWTSKQFTDNEKRDALLMFLNEELLSSSSFNGKLFSKITSELGQVGTFLVNDRVFYAKQDSINLNLQEFYNGLKQENPEDIEGSIKHILYEELIHVLTYKITTPEELDAIVREQGFLVLEKAVEDAYNKTIQITDRTVKGRVLAYEYLRMVIQQDTEQTGSELMLQGAKFNVITKLKEAWEFLKELISKPKTKELVDRHLAFINKKLENTAPLKTSPNLKDYFRRVKDTDKTRDLVKSIEKYLPRYNVYNLESLIANLVELPEFVADLKTTKGSMYLFEDLYKQTASTLLQTKGLIPNTIAFNEAMEMFGYENKSFIFAENVESKNNLENNGQLVEYSQMDELIQELTTGEIPNNTPVLRPDFRLYFNPPLLLKRAKIPVQDTQRYVAIFDSIQERLGTRTLTELRDSREFNRMEWGGILLYALEQALRLEIPINSETIEKIQLFLVGNSRLNNFSFSEKNSQSFFRENFQNGLSREFVSADTPTFQLNLPKPLDSRPKSNATSGELPRNGKISVIDALQKRAGDRNINELWDSGEFNDLEWEQLLILYLRKKLLDTNTFHGRLYKKLKSELGDGFRVDVDNKHEFTFLAEGTEIKINTKQVIQELKKNNIKNINRSLELTLSEEMIHVVSNILRTPQEYKNLFVSQFLNNTELTNNLSEVYRSFKQSIGSYQAPMEFFRMGVQDHFFKQVTEMSAYSLQDFYQALLKGLKYLRDVFVEPANKKLIDEHISYIEDALKQIDEVSYETLMQYNTTPEIWEIAEDVEQFDKFKKEHPTPDNTEELIKDFKEFVQQEQLNTNLECL